MIMTDMKQRKMVWRHLVWDESSTGLLYYYFDLWSPVNGDKLIRYGRWD